MSNCLISLVTLSMHCRATEAWGRFWRRNKESSSSQRLCQQQEAASLHWPTGLESFPALRSSKPTLQLCFLFFFPPPQVSTFTVAEPQIHRFRLGHSTASSYSIAAYLSSNCLALSTIRTIRAFCSDRQQLAGTAGLLIAGTCIALLFIRRPPFLPPTATNALYTSFLQRP